MRSPRRAIDGFPKFGDLIEAGLNEGAAGFARGYGNCIFTRWWMSSLGVAVNGAWWFLRCDEGRRVRWKGRRR